MFRLADWVKSWMVEEDRRVWEGVCVWKLEINAGFDKEPMELLQCWSDVFSKGSSGDDTRSCVLDQLEFME